MCRERVRWSRLRIYFSQGSTSIWECARSAHIQGPFSRCSTFGSGWPRGPGLLPGYFPRHWASSIGTFDPVRGGGHCSREAPRGELMNCLGALSFVIKYDICSAYINYREHGRCSSAPLSKHICILNAIFVDTLKAFRCRIVTDDCGVYSRKRRRQSYGTTGSTHFNLSSCPSEMFDVQKAQVMETMDLSNR